MDKEKRISDNFFQKRWATHTLFWVVLVSFTILQQFLTVFNSRSFHVVLLSFLALVPSQMICAYLLSYYQIPKFLYKKKYAIFVSQFVLTLFLAAMLARVLTVYVAEPIYNPAVEQESIYEILTDPVYLFLVYVPAIWFFPILMASIKIFGDRYRERERIETLKQEKTKAELNFLKAQVHPHFLLNTLNNLYALTLKKSDKAPETVIKLSEMLVYILYKCDERLVLLENEIKLLENYISLERLRYGENLRLEFSKDVDNSGARIAPLILLSMVENAFKHGVSGEVDKAEIRIELALSGDSFRFEVFNTKSKIKQGDETDYTKGIGVSNVRKQLDLVYPNSYKLDIDERDSSYKVLLRLELKADED